MQSCNGWTIRRNHGRTAAATGASVESLAEQIGLDTHDAAHWLTQPAAVPNTVFVVWAGECGRLGRLFSFLASDLRYLRRRGFHVEFRSAAATPPDELLRQLAGASRRRELHGLVLGAHGLPDRLEAGGGLSWRLRYADLVEVLHYRLGLVILNACNAGWSCRDRGIPINEKWGWTDGRSPLPFGVRFPGPKYARGLYQETADRPAGTISAGGRDLVSRVGSGRFHGRKNILNPLTEWCRIPRRLKPGEQGTRPRGLRDWLDVLP